MPYLEINEVVLVQCNTVKNDYQHEYIFVPNTSFGQLLGQLFDQIYQLSINFIFLKTLNSEYSYIEEWFTNQNSTLLEMKDKINMKSNL